MLAVWEYEEDIWRSILFLKLVKDQRAVLNRFPQEWQPTKGFSL